MKIIFVVNTTGLTGGIKVVFTYANGLARKGHKVEIVHLLRLRNRASGYLIAVLKKLKYFWMNILGKEAVDWFDLDRRVRIRRIINHQNIPAGDAVVATANETADWVAKLPEDKGRQIYFIQDYENWTRDVDAVEATYRLSLKKIVVSPHLRRLIKEKSGDGDIALIENGIERAFYAAGDKQKNKKPVIMMQFHVLDKKGVADGLEALKGAAAQRKIKIILFGSYELPAGIDENFEYFYKPDIGRLAGLYRKADIFLNPSREEGFGLPPLEAMAAGCAVITTPTGIMADYAADRTNCLVVKPGRVEAMEQALTELVDNAELRRRIGREGEKTAQRFDWQSSIDKMEKYLQSETA